jgi:predicted transglutaminase-like cysteine proteinase
MVTAFISFFAFAGVVVVFPGCSDGDDGGIFGPKSKLGNEHENLSYHRYVGPARNEAVHKDGSYGMNFGGMNGPLSGSYISQTDPRLVDQVRDSHGRLYDRKEELNRVLHELEVDQRNYEESLRAVTMDYESTKQRLRVEMENHMNLMRNMASMQAAYPPESLYVNAYSAYQRTNAHEGLLKPFSATPPALNFPAPALVDVSGYRDALLKFIDTCTTVASQARAGQAVVSQLNSSKAMAMAATTQDTLNSVASQVNALLSQINSLPRKTISEIWIDPSTIGSTEDRQKLNRLVLQETRSTVSANDRVFVDAGEINTATEVPQLFSVTSSQSSRHHKLKVFRDHKSNQIRIMATCNVKGFESTRSSLESWFFAFTCDDSSRSLTALAEKGTNYLARAVLKVVCHSKEFSKKLVLEPSNRVDRCSVGKWSAIANGIDSSTNFKHLDKKGRRYWRMLTEGTGCFSTDDSSIGANCGSRKSLRRHKRK